MSISINDDELTLGVRGVIPKNIFERVRRLPLHYMLEAKGSACFELDRVRSDFERFGIRAYRPTMFKKLKKKQLRRALSEVHPVPSMDTFCTLIEILETAFILEMIEKEENAVQE